MKILAIRGKNLASIEGEFEINFTAEPLRSAGIFAITGSTGSGKSTLLDALCLALFDETPRNHHAKENINVPDVKDRTINQKDSRNILRRGTSDAYAEVDFISIAGQSFRSRWSVRRSRDKVDGSLQGSEIRLINLKTKLEEQGRKTELLAKLVHLIGLSFEQFTRAVLLAQGDFASFLKANQKEKAEILENLSGTDIYSRISILIYEKSKAAEQVLNILNERIKDIDLLSKEDLENYGIERQEAASEANYIKAQIAELNEKRKWIVQSQTLKKSIEEARIYLEKTEVSLAQAKDRYENLAKIDRVQEIRDSYWDLKNKEKQVEDNRKNLLIQEREQQLNLKQLSQASDKVALWEAQQKKQIEKWASLEPQIRQARALDIYIQTAKTKQNEAKADWEQNIQSKQKKEELIKAMEQAIREAETKLEQMSKWFAQNSLYQEIIPRVDLLVNLIEDAQTATQQRKMNAQSLLNNEAILAEDRIKFDQLKKEAERLNSLLPTEILSLRASLMEGKPCPVCGSLHHPTSGVEGESLEEAELNKAKKEVQLAMERLQTQIETRSGENIRLQSILETYAAQSKEAMDKLAIYLKNIANWREIMERNQLQRFLRETADCWQSNLSEQHIIKEKLISLGERISREKANFEELEQSLQGKENKLKTANAELEKLSTERAIILSGAGADEVETWHLRKSKEISESMDKLNLIKGDLSAKLEKNKGMIFQISQDYLMLSHQKSMLQKTLEDWISAKSASLSMEELAELFSKDIDWLAGEREDLRRLRENNVGAKARLEESCRAHEQHKQSAVKPIEGEDIECLTVLIEEKNTLQEVRSKRLAEIDVLLANHTKSKERMLEFQKEFDEKKALSENWKKLNELYGSADGTKFKVLAQGYTLDILIAYANTHLQQLSKRYKLQRIPDTLALQVMDLDMLSEIRTVHSLSGGESFLISLSLALGLSSLSSNKMKLESLFIDEGFGSLDMDTLRIAMDALENLQTQGRKIGIISHVAEMTERIPTQIKVIKSSQGRSKIEIH